MRKTALPSAFSGASLPTEQLRAAAEDWLLDCELRQLSPATVPNRRLYAGKLLWFLDQHAFATCGTAELRRFFAYLGQGHEAEQAGIARGTLFRAKKPLGVTSRAQREGGKKGVQEWFWSLPTREGLGDQGSASNGDSTPDKGLDAHLEHLKGKVDLEDERVWESLCGAVPAEDGLDAGRPGRRARRPCKV